MRLEGAALSIKTMIDAGAGGAAYALITRAAALAEERDLSGEIKLEAEARNIRQACSGDWARGPR